VSGRVWRPVGFDQRAVEWDMAVLAILAASSAECRPGRGGEGVDAFVQVAVGGGQPEGAQ
jgi:hypothetical protein